MSTMMNKFMAKSEKKPKGNDNWERNAVEEDRGNLEEVLRAMRANADLNAYEPEQWCGDHMTLLLWAAKNGHIDGVRKLLGQGVDAKLRTKKYGFSPLQIAFGCGHKDICVLILDHLERERSDAERDRVLFMTDTETETDTEEEGQGSGKKIARKKKNAGPRIIGRRGGVDEDGR